MHGRGIFSKNKSGVHYTLRPIDRQVEQLTELEIIETAIIILG